MTFDEIRTHGIVGAIVNGDPTKEYVGRIGNRCPEIGSAQSTFGQWEAGSRIPQSEVASQLTRLAYAYAVLSEGLAEAARVVAGAEVIDHQHCDTVRGVTYTREIK